MSFEINAGAPSQFTYDPQVGANETITAGDTWIVQGGNAAIQTANGGADTLNINLVLDPSVNNMLSIAAGGLILDLCQIGGFLDAISPGGISDANSVAWLAGKGASNCLVPVALDATLVPFGNTGGGWSADNDFKYIRAANRLEAGIYRTTTPPTSPTLPILAYIEDATGDIGKYVVGGGNLLIGGASGELSEIAPGSCAALTVKSVNGLNVNPSTGAWENSINREKLSFRSVNANTTLAPATDDVLLVDNSGGNVTITLNSPAACEPTVYHIKQVVTLTTNQIILDPAGAVTIDGAATHVFGNGNAAIRESRMIAWNGTEWHVL